jgi:hypothetical protein
MPYVKISELVAATTPLTGDELLEVAQGGVSKKVAVSDLPGGGSEGAAPFLVHIGFPGSPADGEYLLVPVKLTVAVEFPADFAGSTAILTGVLAAAETILTILKNGVSVGTITFAASGAVGTFASSGGAIVTFAIGDTIAVVNQATADATAANFGIVLAGEQS